MGERRQVDMRVPASVAHHGRDCSLRVRDGVARILDRAGFGQEAHYDALRGHDRDAQFELERGSNGYEEEEK